MTKAFLVLLECGESTRFFCTDEELSHYIGVSSTGVARVWSHGAEPLAGVYTIDNPEILDPEVLAAVKKKTPLK